MQLFKMQLFKGAGAVAVVGAVALGGFGIALGQTQGGSTPPQMELEDQQDANLTPPQMQAKGEEYLPWMEGGARSVRQKLVAARKARDVVKVLCLNDKLNQIDVAVRTASDRLGLLKAAVQRNDADGARHEFTVMRVLRDRVRTLVSEANQCIGEEASYLEKTPVIVEIDPTIPDENPSDLPPDDLVSDPPVVASPTL